MIRRALTIGSYNTALDGKFVTAEMEIGQPEFYEEFQEVPGMHGALDFSEAPVSHPVYKMREISVAFESSRGSVQEREERITEFMAACHGQRLKIVLPDYPDRYLIGRVKLKREFNNLAYCRVSMTAKCEPFFVSELPDSVSLPILSSAVCAISEVTPMTEMSTAVMGWVAASKRSAITLTAQTGAVGSYAVFRLTVAPNTEYYISGKLGAKGYWRVSAAALKPSKFSPFVTSGEDGFLYVWIWRLQPLYAVPLKDVIVIPRDQLSVISAGAASAEASCGKPDGVWLILSVDGVSYPHYGVVEPDLVLEPGDSVAVAMRYDAVADSGAEVVSWHRRWI